MIEVVAGISRYVIAAAVFPGAANTVDTSKLVEWDRKTGLRGEHEQYDLAQRSLVSLMAPGWSVIADRVIGPKDPYISVTNGYEVLLRTENNDVKTIWVGTHRWKPGFLNRKPLPGIDLRSYFGSETRIPNMETSREGIEQAFLQPTTVGPWIGLTELNSDYSNGSSNELVVISLVGFPVPLYNMKALLDKRIVLVGYDPNRFVLRVALETQKSRELQVSSKPRTREIPAFITDHGITTVLGLARYRNGTLEPDTDDNSNGHHQKRSLRGMLRLGKS